MHECIYFDLEPYKFYLCPDRDIYKDSLNQW